MSEQDLPSSEPQQVQQSPTRRERRSAQSSLRSSKSGSPRGARSPTSMSPKSGTRSPRSPRQSPRRSPPDVDPQVVSSYSEQFLAGQPVDCYDPELLAVVVRDLEIHRDNLMISGRFRESLASQKAVDTAREQQLRSCKMRTQSEVQEEIDAKMDSAEQDYDEFKKRMHDKEMELELELRDKIEALKEKQAEELAQHDEDWQKESKQRLYNRSSQKVRYLRVQQALLMNAKRFDEAEQVFNEAEKLVQHEASENHRHMVTDWLQSRSLLQQKHEEEMDTLLKACETRRGEFRFEMMRIERRHQNRMSALHIEEELAKDPERLWILKHRNDGDQITNVMGCGKVVKLHVVPRVCEFNTLPLAPLPVPPSPRSPKKQAAAEEQQQEAHQEEEQH